MNLRSVNQTILPQKDCFELFAHYTNNIHGLCITPIDPVKIQNDYNLHNAEFIHLTGSPKLNNELLPRDLYRLKRNIEHFLDENSESVILIDGLEQLIHQHDWSVVRKFVVRLTSMSKTKLFRILISLKSESVPDDVLSDLKKIISDTYIQLVIEILSNQIRRDVLYFLDNNSPSTFMTVLRSLTIRESPKLSFHLRKLLENKFVTQEKENYSLSPQGVKALQILKHLENEGLIAEQNKTTLFERKYT